MNLRMLGMLATAVLMTGLYLRTHRSIVFVIESLLQTIKIGVLTSDLRDWRSVLLMMARSLGDCISSSVGNTILGRLLLRALTQSWPRGKVLNLYHLLLLILLCLVVLRHRLVGAQVLRILVQRANRRSLVCSNICTRICWTCRTYFFDVLRGRRARHAPSAANAADSTVGVRCFQSALVFVFILLIANLSRVLLAWRMFLYQACRNRASALWIASSSASVIDFVSTGHVTDFIGIIVWQLNQVFEESLMVLYFLRYPLVLFLIAIIRLGFILAVEATDTTPLTCLAVIHLVVGSFIWIRFSLGRWPWGWILATSSLLVVIHIWVSRWLFLHGQFHCVWECLLGSIPSLQLLALQIFSGHGRLFGQGLVGIGPTWRRPFIG